MDAQIRAEHVGDIFRRGGILGTVLLGDADMTNTDRLAQALLHLADCAEEHTDARALVQLREARAALAEYDAILERT